jgi:replicative DNA helicase
VLKQRDGPTGRVLVRFSRSSLAFANFQPRA